MCFGSTSRKAFFFNFDLGDDDDELGKKGKKRKEKESGFYISYPLIGGRKS